MPEEPKTKYAMAFFDGQNLYQHAKAAFGHHHPNYDPIKLHHAVCVSRGWTPNLVRFYTGIPSHTESSMWAGYWAKRLLSLKRSGVQVTSRPIRYRNQRFMSPNGEVENKNVPQEKGIDVRLALDIVSLARKRQYDVAVLFSQDQDLAEVVTEVREIAKEQNRWIRVACAFPAGELATAKRGVNGTDWFAMDQAFYDKCIDPRDYRPPRR